MSKHFLYLTNDRLLGLIWQGGSIVHRASFGVGESGEPFEDYLKRYRNIPVYFCVDLIEEDFRLETIPHLRASDTEAVQSRRLAQIYRNTTYRHAIIQGRETEGRRNDLVLYHAITNPELLKPWLESIARAKIPLEGIYSSPVSSRLLIDELGLTQHNTLLVALVPDTGLRQTYFQDKQMKFSRLTQLNNDGSDSIAKQVASETGRTWQYLESLRFFTVEDRLEVCILAHKSDQALIAEEMRNFPFLRYRFLDIDEVAKTVKLKSAPTHSRAEEIFVQCFATSRLENHYAEPIDRRFAVFRRARISLYGLTAVVLALGLAGAIYCLKQANNVSEEIERSNLSAAQKENEYQQVSNAVRSQSLNSDAVRDTALFFVSQMRPLPAPGLMLRELSQKFAAYPDIALVQLNWETGNNPDAIPAFRATAHSSATVRSEIRGEPGANANAPTQPSPSEGNEASPLYRGNQVQIAMVEGLITPFDGNYRKALARVAELVNDLNTIRGVKARALSLPLDTQDNTLIRTVGDSSTGSAEVGFVLRVQFDPLRTKPDDIKP